MSPLFSPLFQPLPGFSTIDIMEKMSAHFSDLSADLAKGAEVFSTLTEDDVEVASTEKVKVAEFDKVTLYRYQPLEGVETKTDPVLIVYGLIGSYTMIDLQEDRSLVRNLLSRGVDLYVVHWGYPSRADQHLKMEDYVCDYLDSCVEHICETTQQQALTLFGICEGGVFTTMYTAMYPERVNKLMTSITPIDFAAYTEDQTLGHGFLNLWIENLHEEDIDRLLKATGNLSGELMGAVFQAITPIRTLTKYNLDLLNVSSDESKLLNFFRMEKWLADRPHHPAAAAREWLIDLYKENKLVKGNFVLEGKNVDLKNITMPVLNIYAERDHIIPPPCSKSLGKYVGSNDYSELAIPGGHVGIYVSGKLQGFVGDNIAQWLIERQ